MKEMKVSRVIDITLAVIVLIILLTIDLSECTWRRKNLLEYETEHFKYLVHTYLPSREKSIRLIGFTELGLKQQYLVLPDMIDGLAIDGFGYDKATSMWGHDVVGEFPSDNLKKVYVPFVLQEGKSWSNLDGIFHTPVIVRWKVGKSVKTVFDKAVFGYPLYQNFLDEGYFSAPYSTEKDWFANVSYMYNYSAAPDDGYYWADSYDNSVIEFIPPEPTREGYAFVGWYKEPECINAWNFERDTTGAELKIEHSRTFSESDGVHLYAKWIKN